MEEKKLTKNDLVHAIVAISDSIMENLDIIMDDGFPESVGFMVWAIPTSFSLEIVEKYKEQEGLVYTIREEECTLDAVVEVDSPQKYFSAQDTICNLNSCIMNILWAKNEMELTRQLKRIHKFLIAIKNEQKKKQGGKS